MLVVIRNVVELEERFSAVWRANSWTLLDQMRGKTIDSTFWKLLATRLASMLVAIARVVQLGTACEVLKNQRYGGAISKVVEGLG